MSEQDSARIFFNKLNSSVENFENRKQAYIKYRIEECGDDPEEARSNADYLSFLFKQHISKP